LKALLGRQYTTPYNGGNAFPYDVREEITKMGDLPEEFDWRLYGAVTPVKGITISSYP